MIDGLWLALRAAVFVTVLHAAGGALFIAQARNRLAPESLRTLRAAMRRVALVALALVIAQGLFEPLHLAGDWTGFSDAGLRRLVFLGPASWSFWLRIVGVAGLTLALQPGQVAAAGLALSAALVALASFLVSGHALLDTHRLLLVPLLALHVGVAAFWFGSLACLRRLQALGPQFLHPALTLFSRRALWLVPLLAAAGLLIAATLLPDLAALERPYGLLLCVKALLFVLLMGLAALNRLRLAPALARGEPQAGQALRMTLGAEYLLIVAVLVATAAMTGLFSPAEVS